MPPEIEPVKPVSGYVAEKPVVAPPAEKPPEQTSPPAPAAKVEDDKLDDLGYEKVEPVVEDKKPDSKVDAKPEDVKIEKPATGYGEEPPKIVEEVKPPEEKKDADLGYELKVDEIIPKEEVSKIKAFAKQHGLTKEVAQAYFDLRKTEVQEYSAAVEKAQKAFEQEKLQTRAKWHKELKDDPSFGGEKFAVNVQRAERVLQDFMPGTKKMLTERGSVLPPYVMRDLAKLAEHLYATGEKLVQGNATMPPEDKKQEDDALAFYE